MTYKISKGILHKAPVDIQNALTSYADILVKWNNLTLIQRDEWICWATLVKKMEIRVEHFDHMRVELKERKTATLQLAWMPACRQTGPHRRPNAKKWFKNLEI